MSLNSLHLGTPRVATDIFRTSPRASVTAETREMPLAQRADAENTFRLKSPPILNTLSVLVKYSGVLQLKSSKARPSLNEND